MLKSCVYCHRIHDSKHICKQRQVAINNRKNRFNRTDKDKFRSTNTWNKKRTEIKERDSYLCQVCIRKLYDTVNQFTYDSLEVHHAIPLEKDFDKRLNNDNLITLCERHHEMAERKEIPYKVIKEIIDEQEDKCI